MKLMLWKNSEKNRAKNHEAGRTRADEHRQIRVLMIDDEEGFVRLTKRNLEAHGGFTVQAETSARNAVPIALAFRPDVILLDVMMPDGGGGEVASRLAEHPELKEIPILFLTAAIKGAELGHRSGGMIGGRFYIAKPVHTEQLVEYIRHYAPR